MTKARMLGVMGSLVLLGLLGGAGPAEAQCGGRSGSFRGGYYGGHTFGRGVYARGGGTSCCSGGGIHMAGMRAMPMAPAMSYGNGMQAMNGYAAPTAAAYSCPMHPGVVSNTPATCPYCSMALTRR